MVGGALRQPGVPSESTVHAPEEVSLFVQQITLYKLLFLACARSHENSIQQTDDLSHI